jgi:hypothetical protein
MTPGHSIPEANSCPSLYGFYMQWPLSEIEKPQIPRRDTQMRADIPRVYHFFKRCMNAGPRRRSLVTTRPMHPLLDPISSVLTCDEHSPISLVPLALAFRMSPICLSMSCSNSPAIGSGRLYESMRTCPSNFLAQGFGNVLVALTGLNGELRGVAIRLG